MYSKQKQLNSVESQFVVSEFINFEFVKMKMKNHKL